tara:strand:+ start:17103 stop:17453 length:351 start_codon:yes stop_codon:yes gene_type:complete
MFTGEIGGDENIFLALFEVLVGLSKETKPLGGDFKKTIDIDRISGEFKGLSLTRFIARTVAPDPTLSLPASVAIASVAIASVAIAIAVTVTVSIAVTALVVVAVACIGGLSASGVR